SVAGPGRARPAPAGRPLPTRRAPSSLRPASRVSSQPGGTDQPCGPWDSSKPGGGWPCPESDCEDAAMAAPEIADLDPDERDIVAVVHDWVHDSVLPVARDLEHADAYPAELIEAMKRFGVYGLVIPERYGGAGVSTACCGLVPEDAPGGGRSRAGGRGGHGVVARLTPRFGPDDQKDPWLPRMATAEVRAARALTEPAGGSDLQAIRTRAEAAP